MTTLIIALITHIILGLVGIMALYMVWMGLLKKSPKIDFLKWASVVSAVSFFASWLSGGYYYVLYYGGVVKPVIKAGEYAWAHSIVMETKEHIFLFLPVATVFLAIALFARGSDLEKSPALKRSLVYVAGISTLIAIAITLGGIIISGSVR